MHINYLESLLEAVLLFLFHSKVKFLMRFGVFLDLIILVYFNDISIFLCGKELYLHIFFVISVFISGKMHIVEI